jgi:hypothetical protein
MRLFVINAVLLALIALAVVGTSAFQRPASNVEAAVRRYADAVSTSNLDGALAEIAPAERDTYQPWLESQLGNVYEVKGIAVRAPAFLAGAPYEVTVVLDVNRDDPTEFYEPTTTTQVEQVDGKWYLARPLLASD